MNQSENDHSNFYCHSITKCINFIVYVDNIVITRSDHHSIAQVKYHHSQHFQTKYVRRHIYFFGI